MYSCRCAAAIGYNKTDTYTEGCRKTDPAAAYSIHELLSRFLCFSVQQIIDRHLKNICEGNKLYICDISDLTFKL